MIIRGVLTFFAWLFLLDGVMSLILQGLQMKGGTGGWFTGPQLLMAMLAFGAALTLYAFSAFFTQVPKRIVVPAALFLLWTNFCGAFPLELWTKEHTGMILSGVQCAMGVWFLLAYRGREQFFPLRNPAEHRPEFSWRSLTLYAVGNLALMPVLFVLFALNATVTTLEKTTAGFISVRPDGVFIQERLFEKEGRRVHLVGMMHVANSHFYDGIIERLPAKSKSIVLLEGVSDRNNVLKGDLGMQRLGKLLGLKAQSDSTFTERAAEALEAEEKGEPSTSPVRYLRSDRDISDFRVETIACLREVGALGSAHSWRELLLRMQNPQSPLHRDQNARIMMEDILNGRNEFLFAKIEESLPAYDNIIVPWGAMHMPYLSQRLLEKGFREVSREDRKALAF